MRSGIEKPIYGRVSALSGVDSLLNLASGYKVSVSCFLPLPAIAIARMVLRRVSVPAAGTGAALRTQQEMRMLGN